MRMKRKLLCAFALCFLSVSALADAPDETERLAFEATLLRSEISGGSLFGIPLG